MNSVFTRQVLAATCCFMMAIALQTLTIAILTSTGDSTLTSCRMAGHRRQNTLMGYAIHPQTDETLGPDNIATLICA